MKFEDVGDTAKKPIPKKKTKPIKKPINSITTANSKEPNVWKIEGLPSCGRTYLNGIEFFGRPLKVLEVKKLSSMTDVNMDYIINDILKRTIKGLDLDSLLMGDKLYLIFWLRANTYKESGFTVPFTCNLCEAEESYDFTLDNLQIKYLTDKYSEDKLIFTANNKDKIKFHLLTVKEEPIKDKFKSQFGQVIKGIDDDILDIAMCIDSINGDDLKLFDIYNYLVDISPSEFSYITSYIRQFDFGTLPVLNVKCNSCGGDSPVAVTFREDFFFPRYKFE